MLALSWLMRSAHILAGAVWVGGSMLYLLVVVPALRLGKTDPQVVIAIATRFKSLTTICIGVLLLSGGYMVMDRLTSTVLPWSYLLILIVKILAALAMFALAMYVGQSNVRKLAKRSTRFSQAAPKLLLSLGVVVFLLGAWLNLLFTLTIAPR